MIHFLTAYIAAIIFVFGTVIGSFLNVLIYRLPIGMDFKKGNSICTTCKHQLNWKDLFPLFSWIFLGGKCRYCKAPISPRYPIVEALNGIAYVLVYLFLCGGYAIEGLSLKLVGYMIMMFCAGASEIAMAEWASMFAQEGLGVSQVIGDLAGPSAFAVFIGLAVSGYVILAVRAGKSDDTEEADVVQVIVEKK